MHTHIVALLLSWLSSEERDREKKKERTQTSMRYEERWTESRKWLEEVVEVDGGWFKNIVVRAFSCALTVYHEHQLQLCTAVSQPQL